jgi:hypothetical protein
MPGFHPLFTIIYGIAAELTRIERARGFLEAATLSESWIREMIEKGLIVSLGAINKLAYCLRTGR